LVFLRICGEGYLGILIFFCHFDVVHIIIYKLYDGEWGWEWWFLPSLNYDVFCEWGFPTTFFLLTPLFLVCTNWFNYWVQLHELVLIPFWNFHTFFLWTMERALDLHFVTKMRIEGVFNHHTIWETWRCI